MKSMKIVKIMVIIIIIILFGTAEVTPVYASLEDTPSALRNSTQKKRENALGQKANSSKRTKFY